jgi:hypothetical protein
MWICRCSRAGGKDNTGRPSQTTIQSNGSFSETVRNRTHVHIFFLRMTDTITSQNINLSSWDTLYMLQQVGIAQSVQRLSYRGWTVQARVPVGARDFFSSPKHNSEVHPVRSSVGAGFHSGGHSGLGAMLTSNFHLALRLRMNGVSPPLPLYALIKWTGLLIFLLSLILEVRTNVKECGLTAAMLSLHVAQNCHYIYMEYWGRKEKYGSGRLLIQPRFEPCTSVPQVLHLITTNLVHICS